MDEQDHLRLIRQKIEESLNWGDSGQWSNQDFESLSEKVHEKTHVRLSVSTLKRIWGKVKYDHSPTSATLNALANFVGYEGWRDFQAKTRVTAPSNVQPVPPRRSLFTGKIVSRIAYVLVLTGGVLTAMLLIRSQTPDSKAAIQSKYDVSLARFSSREVTDDLPNSVIFDYDASAFKADSVFIQQSWDPHRRKKVSPQGKQHTSIYFYPGYFEAKLIVNDQIVKEHPVYIKTNGWKGIIGMRSTPVYLAEKDIHQGGQLGVTSELLRSITGKPVFNDLEVTFCNVREFEGVNGKDFSISMRLRNTSTVEEAACRRVNVTILYKGGVILIPLATKGCVSDLGVMTGERYISGKTTDLSAFGCDFSTLQDLTCNSKDGLFSISLNGKIILEERQEKPVGDIVGLRISFEGAGEIDGVRVDGAGKAVYEEQF